MARRSEIWALRLELLGLVMVMTATSWQVLVSDWFGSQPAQWRYQIQEEVNLALMRVLRSIGEQLATQDAESRREIYDSASKKINETVRRTVEERTKLNHWTNGGQYSVSHIVKNMLFVFGAAFFVAGKYLSLRSAQRP